MGVLPILSEVHAFFRRAAKPVSKRQNRGRGFPTGHRSIACWVTACVVLATMAINGGCRPQPVFDESEVESFRPQLDPVEEVETIGEVRTWTPASGGRPIQGALIKVEDGKIFIKKTDGHILGVPAERLSEEDRNYARQAAAAAR